jgi:thiamine-phosphate pyrophosphorylase
MIWKHGGLATRPIVAVSCHSAEDVACAAAEEGGFAVLAPIFGKKDAPQTPPLGLDALRRACQENILVLALGGITLENWRACVEAGAAGVAGIRLFQENDVAEVARKLGAHP